MPERYGSRCRKDAFPASPGADTRAPIRHTECDGRRATWRLDSETIRILDARDTTGASVELPGRTRTDLAEMRERFPEHTPLWDAIRRDFWTHAVAPGCTG
ncbi:hypothetical protein [Nocardia sp. NPDC003345]